MSVLLVGDLHLSALPRDAYRWQVFGQLAKICRFNELIVDIVLLGDLTDEKDRHPAQLVNEITTHLLLLQRTTKCDVHVLRGNHDGIDPAWPYFRFLNDYRGIYFYDSPCVRTFDTVKVAMLPHSRDPVKDWGAPVDARFAFAHITVQGAVSESGVPLRSSIDASYFARRDMKVYAGDVHVPQTIRPVTYVGAPYPIRFGDSFKPRVIVLSDKLSEEKSVDLTAPRRLMLDVEDVDAFRAWLDNEYIGKGDQAKVRLILPSDQLGAWADRRKEITAALKGKGVDLVAIELVRKQSEVTAAEIKQTRGARTPRSWIKRYIKAHNTDKACAAVGLDLIERVQ